MSTFVLEQLLEKHKAKELFTRLTAQEFQARFSELHQLGDGTFGVVYRVVHNGRVSAIKELKELKSSTIEGLITEALNLRRCAHLNVLKLHGAFFVEVSPNVLSRVFLETEFC